MEEGQIKQQESYLENALRKRLHERHFDIWYIPVLADFKAIEYDNYRNNVRFIDALRTLCVKIRNSPV